MYALARNGERGVLTWAIGAGCRLNSPVCLLAATHGDPEVLKWAKSNGCPGEARTCATPLRKEAISRC